MSHNPVTQNVPNTIWQNYSLPPSGAAIYSISGGMTDGSVITIKGKGFGQGPSNFRYENFSNFTSAGQLLSDVDNIYDTVEIHAKSATGGRSGTYCLDGYGLRTADYRAASCGVDLGSTDEVFCSYSVKNPIGFKMPNLDTNTPPNTFASGSSAKFAWLYRDSQNGSGNDIVLPTLVSTAFSVVGNDLVNWNNSVFGPSPDSWVFGDWVRMSTWLKAGATPDADVTGYMFQMMNDTNGISTSTAGSRDSVFENGTAPYHWNKLDIPGWLREQNIASNPTADEIKVLYDDVYMAWGDNAAARVEIGNNANYGLCTKLSICDVVKDWSGSASWGDEQIVLNLRQSDLDFDSDVFLFVTGADNAQLVARKIL